MWENTHHLLDGSGALRQIVMITKYDGYGYKSVKVFKYCSCHAYGYLSIPAYQTVLF